MLWCITYVMMYYICYDVRQVSWCILYVEVYFCNVWCQDSWHIRPIVRGETCGWLIYEPTRAYLSHLYHITHSCIHLSARHLVPDGLPRTFCVVLVYRRHYTRAILCVMHWWEPPVHQYHVVYGGVMYDIYVIYMSYVFTHCIFFYSLPTN